MHSLEPPFLVKGVSLGGAGTGAAVTALASAGLWSRSSLPLAAAPGSPLFGCGSTAGILARKPQKHSPASCSENSFLPDEPQLAILSRSPPFLIGRVAFGNHLENLLGSQGNDLRRVQPNQGSMPGSVSGIEDSVASSFKKFHDLVHLVSLDAHFFQRFAKVP